jgi:hypothetical protein
VFGNMAHGSAECLQLVDVIHAAAELETLMPLATRTTTDPTI